MSYYRHTDLHGDFVQVELHEDGAWVIINQGRGGAAITLDMAEARRFTDAVLDAAIAHEDRKQKAEQAAGDAKVREFRAAFHSPLEPPYLTAWCNLPDTNKESWRARYRATREFFEEQE